MSAIASARLPLNDYHPHDAPTPLLYRLTSFSLHAINQLDIVDWVMKQMEKEVIAAASAEVSQEFKNLINSQDLDSLKQLQHIILGRLQDSNAVLSHFNDYSEQCFAELSSDLSTNTHLLKSMKSDLDYIFQKLRSLKAKIKATYPDAFPDDSTMEALDRRPDLEVAQ